MRGLLAYTFVVLCFVSGSIGKKGFGPGEQEWNFVKVRDRSFMFWWLYYTTANVNSYYDRPLLIWLQGGPGESSTSYGNFEELGPLDVNLTPRNYTWVKDYNVLFIDSPVGTGFSYAHIEARFTKANEQIAKDLVECMRGFYKELPQFENVPAYITTETYGGKMGAEFALLWDKAQKNGTIKSNLKGIALGDAWISPIDSVLTWAPYLLNAGVVDTEGFKRIDAAAQKAKKMADGGAWTAAYEEYIKTQNVILQETYDINFYNILTKVKWVEPISQRHSCLSTWDTFLSRSTVHPNFNQNDSTSLKDLMNGAVRETLNITTRYMHGEQSSKVFYYLKGDFMKPVTHIVERLLNETTLNVFVYNGQFDLIVNTLGTVLWIDKLKWENADRWKNSQTRPITIANVIQGYSKVQDNFGMYWVHRAGHMVPRDHPAVQKRILQDLTSNAYL